ncbi:MAG: NAD(P)-dependent oxidoreductase [Candidatus Acidiferrum sp.]
MMKTCDVLARDLEHVLASTSDLWEELRGRRIFITGATGFFGCWLLETFAWANKNLALDSTAVLLTRNPQKLRQRVPHLADRGLEIVVGDVRNFTFPDNEFSHIIHAATESSAELNAQQPQLMFDTIVEGTRHCLDFAVSSGATKFLLTSSGAVYGKQPSDLTRVPEDFTGGPDPLEPDSAYAQGKRAAELLCVLAAKQTGLQVKIARCFAFVGPYMKLDAHFAIGNFIRDHLEGAPIRVRGDSTPVRSYMYASDLMIWLWTILFRGNSCRAYNVGSEESISIGELAGSVAETGSAHTPVEVFGMPLAGASVARYVPSTARAQQELGLRCTVSLGSAIERTVEWNRAQSPGELQNR